LDDARERLSLPGEPAGLRAEMRALLEDSPEGGARVVEDATFVADPLWAEWGDILEGLGMDRARFLEISRGYSDELRLWVVGERPWIHCVSGLAGRVRRRLSVPNRAASRR
jgi:hypothetical protein